VSTVDPRVVREQKQRDAQASPTRWFERIAFLAVHAALWGLAGFGFGFVLDSARLSTINQVGSGWSSPYDDGLMLLGAAGVMLGSFFSFAVTRRLASSGLLVASLTPLVSGLLGAAIGAALFIPLWTPPEAVGHQLPFMDGPIEPWGAGEWIAYLSPYWVPGLLAVLAVGMAIAVAILSRRSRRKRDRMNRLMATGTKASGTVTEVVATGTEVQGMPRLQFTVKFADASGVSRWVTKKANFPPASVPRAGDDAVVWFDPLNPGDETDIVVGLGPDAATEAATSA